MKNIDLNAIQTELGKIRKTILAIQDERNWIETSRPSKEELISRFNRQVDDLAENSQVIKHMFAEMNPFHERVGLINGGINGVDLGPILCGLLGDEIKQKMADKIAALDYEAGPPLSERQKLLAQNADQLLQLEIAEEELICEAEQRGWLIERRPDVRPEIFLEWQA